MTESAQRKDEFWIDLEKTVAKKVERALREGRAGRRPLIEYLRHLEEMVRTECDRRQTVQIIASGRSILGDRRSVGPKDGPFARASR